MLLRSILELSSRRAVRRIPRQITTQACKTSGSVSKLVFGSAVVGAAILAAYQTGYWDQVFGGKDQHDSLKAGKGPIEGRDVKDIQQFESHSVLPESKEADEVASAADEKVKTPPDQPHVEDLTEKQDGVQSQAQDKSDATPDEGAVPIKEKDLPDDSQSKTLSYDQSSLSGVKSEGAVDVKTADENTDKGSNKEVQTSQIFTQTNEAEKQHEVQVVPPVHVTIEIKEEEDAAGKDVEQPSSLLEAYLLEDKYKKSGTYLNRHGDDDFGKEKEALGNALEELGDGYITKDGKLVLDFLQAIHAAEDRQAELDARLYTEEKRALKEKYEKELKDAAVRELMLAEEAAMLDKELKRERAKAAAALKSLQEKLEEKYKTELEQKQLEAEFKLEKVEELAKAELTATIASEKAAQIERIAEANLHGALALEDALSKGLPIQTEIEALHNYLEGIDKDSILDLFDALKGTLRHFSLIPPGGGGILAHSVVHIATWLKVKEADESGDGVESLINKVESYLAEGKIAEAAIALEEGIQGTQASEIVGEWVRRARNRAITEQALTLLQSYATSISLG
ncbi:hypothetical protein TIFTF001_004244 [Ficus carica]|uniref:MICOS complex subunit MIC60 n=1 Tax=Ficus carica TaxID=3494 RepID=A0AA87ZUM3_FICCA|nr:hypothetical protein TIFTF001_004244 [Ficus carica]